MATTLKAQKLTKRNKKIIQLVVNEGMTHEAAAANMGLKKSIVDGVIRRFKANGLMLKEGQRSIRYDNLNVQEIKGPPGLFVRTLDQLIEFMKIDLEEWILDRPTFNFWGNMDNPNGQVKVKAVRRHPLPIQPVVQPVEVRLGRLPKAQPVRSEWKRALMMFDGQVGFRKSLRTAELTPFHDRRAIDIGLQIAQAIKPDFIGFGGDWMDLADWSDKFTRSPNFYWTTQPAALELAWWMAQFRKVCPNARIAMIPGNHEARLDRALLNNLKEGYGLRAVDEMHLPPSMSIPRLLGLHTMGVEYVGEYPDGVVAFSKVAAMIHGDKVGHGGTVSNKLLQDAQYSLCYGHTHRIEKVYRTLHTLEGPRTIWAMSPGCMCKIDGGVPGVKDLMDWQQGVAVVDYTDEWSIPHEVEIKDGAALFEGGLFTARERREELIEATRGEDGKPWPF